MAEQSLSPDIIRAFLTQSDSEKKKPDFESLLSLLRILESNKENKSTFSVEERIGYLNECLGLYHEENEFKVGQLVKWKKGLKHKKKPLYGEPVIVAEVLQDPIFDPVSEAGSTYFSEKLDIKLGLLDSDGDFIIFHFDSSRFEPYTQ